MRVYQPQAMPYCRTRITELLRGCRGGLLLLFFLATTTLSRAQPGTLRGAQQNRRADSSGAFSSCKQFPTISAPQLSANAERQLSLSRLLSSAGQMQDAEGAVEQSLSLQTTAAGWYQLALVRFARADAACSLEAFTAAAALRRPGSEDLRIVALDYVLLHDEPDAEKWLRASINLDPRNVAAWYDLGRVFYTANRFPEAANALDQASALDPENVKAETYLGLIAESESNLPRAESLYRKAIAIESASAKPFALPYLCLGILLRDSGRLDEAATQLKKAVSIAPDDPANDAELGACFARQELWNEARVAFEAALRKHGSKPAWHFQLGRVYHALGRDADARIQFDLAKTQIEAAPELGPEQ